MPPRPTSKSPRLGYYFYLCVPRLIFNPPLYPCSHSLPPKSRTFHSHVLYLYPFTHRIALTSSALAENHNQLTTFTFYPPPVRPHPCCSRLLVYTLSYFLHISVVVLFVTRFCVCSFSAGSLVMVARGAPRARASDRIGGGCGGTLASPLGLGLMEPTIDIGTN